MRMVGSGIDPQIAELNTGQGATRQHALDRLLDDALGKLALIDRLGGPLFDAANEARVMKVNLLLFPAPASREDDGTLSITAINVSS